MTTSLLSLAAALTLAAGPASPARRVAVLDFRARWSDECAGKALAEAQAERCEVLRLFADKARLGALSVLRPPAYVVMTRENAAQVLKDMGGQCSEGECEVETARLLGAAIVVSGEVAYVEGSWIVSLKAHDVASAALLGGADTRGKTKLEALDNVRAETERMLRDVPGLEGAPPGVAAPRAAPSGSGARPGPPGATPELEKLRRWYVEGRYGYARLVEGSVTPPDSRPTGAKDAGMRVGFRFSPSWSAEIGGSYMAASSGHDRNAYGEMHMDFGDSWRFGAGADFAPLGNPFFSVAGEIGFTSLSARSWAEISPSTYSSEVRQRRSGAELQLEARGHYPLGGGWYLGARVGAMVALYRFDLANFAFPWRVKVASLNGNLSYVPFSVALGYRF